MKTKNQNLKEKKWSWSLNPINIPQQCGAQKREKKKLLMKYIWGKCFFRRHDCASLFFH